MVDVDTPPITPEQITPHQISLIIDALNSKGAFGPCYRCGNAGHSVHNSLTTIQLNGATSNIMLGGQVVPAAIVFCGHCGLISMHALGSLGLLHHPAFGFQVEVA
jgi:hypothetical protein